MPENNNVSLSDLANGATPTAAPVGMPVKPKLDTSNVKPVNLNDVALPGESEKPVEGTGNPMLDQAFLGLDKTIDRLADESAALIEKGNAERIEQAIDNADGDIDDDDEVNTVHSTTLKVAKFDDSPILKEESTVKVPAAASGTKEATISMVKDTSVYDEPAAAAEEDDEDDNLFDIDDEDMKFLEDEDEEETKETEEESEEQKELEKEKREKIKETIRREINQNFSPVSNKLDLNGFTIAKKPINAAQVVNDIKTKAIECADGVLFSEKRAVRMSSYSAMEIQSLDTRRVTEGIVTYNSYIDNKLRLIYKHIIDANKPKSFEAWAMMTPNSLVDDYMFTAYKATFGTSNIVTYNCSNDECNNVFMENIPVHSMIKFKTDEIKAEYMNILNHGVTDSSKTDYKVTLYQASDEYVFGLKVPSIYNTYIEPTLVDQKFSKKYEDLILLLTYIDSIYKIDLTSKQLIPIDTKPVKTDNTLTYKRRIKTFATILRSLTSDQIQALSVETDKYDNGTLDEETEKLIRDVSYVFPERVCPKCGKKIDEVEVNPDNMLFIRHQLGLMKKI